MKGKLYLIPTTLGENEPLEVMPYSVKTIVELLNHYVVENEKSSKYLHIIPRSWLSTIIVTICREDTTPLNSC